MAMSHVGCAARTGMICHNPANGAHSAPYGGIMSLVGTQYFTVCAAVRTAHPTVVGLLFAGTFIPHAACRTHHHHGCAPDRQTVRTVHHSATL